MLFTQAVLYCKASRRAHKKTLIFARKCAILHRTGRRRQIMLDCAIVGSGVAGISAALTLKANGKNFVLLGSPELSVKIASAERIRNYPGLSDVKRKKVLRGAEKTACGSGNFRDGRTGDGRLRHGGSFYASDGKGHVVG